MSVFLVMRQILACNRITLVHNDGALQACVHNHTDFVSTGTTLYIQQKEPIQSNEMSVTEARQGPLFPSLSKNLKYKNANKL